MTIEEKLKYKARRFLYQLDQQAYLNKQKALRDMHTVNKNQPQNDMQIKECPKNHNNDFNPYNKICSYNNYDYHDVYSSDYDKSYQNNEKLYYDELDVSKNSNFSNKLTDKFDEIENYLEELMHGIKKTKR